MIVVLCDRVSESESAPEGEEELDCDRVVDGITIALGDCVYTGDSVRVAVTLGDLDELGDDEGVAVPITTVVETEPSCVMRNQEFEDRRTQATHAP